MSQQPYNVISQGPVSVQMDQYGVEQRIMPPPKKWCTPRRTKVIVAIVVMSIIYILFMIGYLVLKSKTTVAVYDLRNDYN